MSPPTLLSLSSEFICKNGSQYGPTLEVLPGYLKSKLLKLMSKRGTLNTVSLASLLSPHEICLDLSRLVLDNECLVAIRACNILQTLNISPQQSQVHAITCQALMELFPCLTRLTELCMRECPAVSDEVIESVAKHCPHLTVLDVGACTALTDKSLNAIAEGLPELKCLSISRSQVTDSGLACLSNGRSQHSLEELEMSNCLGVTNEGVASVVSACSAMKYLTFLGCPIHFDPGQESLAECKNIRHVAFTVF